jgi:hypothetical protein
MVQTRLEAQAAQARFLAQTVLLDVQRATSAEAVRDTLERQQATASARYPFLSIALVPVRGVTCPPGLLAANAGRTPPVLLPVRSGEWAHDGVGRAAVVAHDLRRPRRSPTTRPTTLRDGGTDLRIAARAGASGHPHAVLGRGVDLPISAVVERRRRTKRASSWAHHRVAHRRHAGRRAVLH